MAKDLRYHLERVQSAGPAYYREIKKAVRPDYDIGIIQEKLALIGAFPVLYCPRVEGHPYPVVSNLFGHYEALGLALDLSPAVMQAEGRSAVLQEYRQRGQQMVPHRSIPADGAPVREVICQGGDIDLNRLPVARHAERNGGRYITLGVTVIQDPDSGVPNAGIYRQMITGRDRLTCMTVASHDGARLIERHRALGKPVEVATFIGHHPAVMMAAAFPLMPGQSEYDYAGGLLGEPLMVTGGVSVAVPVPVDAEIVIEGRIDPERKVKEGPFSEALGFYDEGRQCYEIAVSAVTHRRDAIYANLCPLHQEHLQVNILGREAKAFEAVRAAVPSVKAVHIGPDGRLGKGIFYVSLQNPADGDAERTATAVMSADRYCKCIIIVDADVDVFEQSEVLWALGAVMKDRPAVAVRPGKAFETVIIDATRDPGKVYAGRCFPPQDRWEAIRLEDWL